jgi:hypothetical protein
VQKEKYREFFLSFLNFNREQTLRTVRGTNKNCSTNLENYETKIEVKTEYPNFTSTTNIARTTTKDKV